MARPIPFESPRVDPRMELGRKLDRAPVEHAAALLDAYDLLQAMHDRGWLDTMRGVVGSGDAVLDIAVEGAIRPESIHAMRNALVLFNLIGTIDPDTLKKFTEPVSKAFSDSSDQTKAPGLWSLMKGSIFNADFRRGLAAMTGILRGVGGGLGKSK